MSAAADKLDFDVLIVGGGLVGASLALALGQSGRLQVGLIEAHAIGPATGVTHYDDRSVAVAHGSRLIFSQFGLGRVFEDLCTPIVKIHVSERGRFGAMRMTAREENVPALGYVVENRILGNALIGALSDCDSVVLLDACSVSSLHQSDKTASVEIEHNGDIGTLSARWLIAADGADSSLREMAGLSARVHDYQQVAVIANVSVENAHNHVAYERFTDTGPLALLPLSGNRCSLVMTVRAEQKEDVLSMNDATFGALLQDRFGHRMGAFTKVGARSAFPLRLVTANASGKGRVALIGNARHYLHPVSGQGFNLAMRDVGVITELLQSGATALENPAAFLRAVEQRRDRDHHIVERITDTLARLFTVPFTPLAHLRASGLIATDLLPFIRHGVARQSMGLRERLPRVSPAS